MGGFKCGLGFDDAAGGVCKSMCIAIAIILGLLGLTCPVT